MGKKHTTDAALTQAMNFADAAKQSAIRAEKALENIERALESAKAVLEKIRVANERSEALWSEVVDRMDRATALMYGEKVAGTPESIIEAAEKFLKFLEGEKD